MLGSAGCHAHQQQAASSQQQQQQRQEQQSAPGSLQYASGPMEPFASQQHHYQLGYPALYPTFVDHHHQAHLLEADHFGAPQLEAANHSFGAEYLELDAPPPPAACAEQGHPLSYAHLNSNLSQQQQQQQQQYAAQQPADFSQAPFSLADELGAGGAEFAAGLQPGGQLSAANEQLLVQQLDSGHASSNASCLLEHSSASSLLELQQPARDSVLSRGPLTQAPQQAPGGLLYGCPLGRARRLSASSGSLSGAVQAAQLCPAQAERRRLEQQEPFKVCEWEGCYNTFISMPEFVRHLEERHVNQNPKEKNRYFCLWARCKRNELEFNARYKLLIHMRVHSGEKPYPCSSANCAKSFSRLENLKIHVRSHTGEKPYKCNFNNCAKSFTNSSDRIKHHKTHRDPKPYSCSHHNCAKRYTDPSSLRKHLRAHKRQPPADLAPVTADFNALALHQPQQQQLKLEADPHTSLIELEAPPELGFATPSRSSEEAWRPHESAATNEAWQQQQQQQQQHNQLSRSWCAGGSLALVGQEPAPWQTEAARRPPDERRCVRWEAAHSGAGGAQQRQLEAEERALMRSLPASNSLAAGWRAAQDAELQLPRPNRLQQPS